MFKLIRNNSLLIKSILKFWMLTGTSLILLIAFQKGISKIYQTVFKELIWEFFTPFLILLLSMGILIAKTLQLRCEKVIWKPYDAILTATLLYYIRIFVLDFTAIEISFVDFIQKENNSLLFLFILLTCLYVCIKFILWPKNFILKTKTDNESDVDQYNQDLSLELMKGFEDITDIDKLKDLDKLGRFDHAQQISEVINNVKPKKSFAIGINGDWGSGKTSFIHLVRRINQIEHPNACKFITFNPWYFTGTEKVLLKFHETLLSSVGSFSLSFRNELHRYFQLVCATETSIWKTNFLQYFKKGVDFQSQQEKLKEYFKQLPQKTVIIIDDLDRLQKDEILVLFRTIRLIADFPNVVYLVGYSPDYVKNILDDTRTDDQPGFMEKIFQLEFELPEPMPSDLRTFWKSVIEKHIPYDRSDLQMEIINNIVTNNILPNLRDIKRFLNQLTINSSLPEIKNNTYFPQFFLLELIYYCDTDEYFRIWKKGSFGASEKVKPETKTIINQIAGLKDYSEKSITNREHFGKYFFKRLDRELEIDYKDVENLFIEENYKTSIEKLYTKNKKQLSGYILDYTISISKNRDSFDKDFAISYFDRVFHLIRHSYLKEQLVQKYFTDAVNNSNTDLFTAIAKIWQLSILERKDAIKEYLRSKIDWENYSSILVVLAKQEEIKKIYFDFNSLLIEKIEIQSKSHNPIILLLTDLYNYQLFLKSNPIAVKAHNWLGNKNILTGLRNNSENINKEIDRISDNQKNIKILDFFGSKETLLKLNDLQHPGIFKMLESLNIYYPIRNVSNENVFKQEFKYDKYNYRIIVPYSIKNIKIALENGEEPFGVKEINKNIFTFWKKTEGEITEYSEMLTEPWKGNYYIELYRHDEGVFLILSNKLDKSTTDKNVISNDPYSTFELTIRTNNYEEFNLERQLIPDNRLSYLEKNKPNDLK